MGVGGRVQEGVTVTYSFYFQSKFQKAHSPTCITGDGWRCINCSPDFTNYENP